MLFESLRKLKARRETGEGGFTLVELLIVIVILGILAAIVVLAIGGLSGTSKTAACNADVKTIQTAEDAYFASLGQNTTYVTVDALQTANLLKADATLDAKFGIAFSGPGTVAGVSGPVYVLTGTGDCTGSNGGSA